MTGWSFILQVNPLDLANLSFATPRSEKEAKVDVQLWNSGNSWPFGQLMPILTPPSVIRNSMHIERGRCQLLIITCSVAYSLLHP
jgi:hypothetical protein